MSMKLMTVREFADAEFDGNTVAVYRQINNGAMPVIKTGEKKGFRISQDMYRRHLRGEPVPDRYFMKAAAG